MLSTLTSVCVCVPESECVSCHVMCYTMERGKPWWRTSVSHPFMRPSALKPAKHLNDLWLNPENNLTHSHIHTGTALSHTKFTCCTTLKTQSHSQEKTTLWPRVVLEMHTILETLYLCIINNCWRDGDSVDFIGRLVMTVSMRVMA